MNARILIVEHEAAAGAALIGQRLTAHQCEVTVCGPDTLIEVPTEARGYDGVVVLGGPMGPLDDAVAPWLPAARALIRDAVQRETPLLGVCLGAQLMAVALDGVVQPMATPEVGTAPVHVSAEGRCDPLFADLPADCPTLHWHWLHVAQLPTGATVLASTEATAVQAYRVGTNAWATQFHLEADPHTAVDWATHTLVDLPAAGFDPQRIMTDWAANVDHANAVWSEVIDRWIAIADAPAAQRP